MSLSFKVSALLSLILAFSLALSAALGYAKFEKALSGVIFSRQHVTTRSLADDIETGLNLGLTLAEIQNFRPLVERAAREHPDLLLAEVVDAGGHQVFMHGESSVQAIRTWSAQVVPASGWKKFGDHTIAHAEPLFNSFGQRVGIVIVEFSRSGFDRTLAGIFRFTLTIFLSVTAGGGVLCLITGQLLHGPLNRALEQVESQLYLSAESTPEDPSAGATHIAALTATVKHDIRAISEKFRNERA
jgi:hypothetical protein